MHEAFAQSTVAVFARCLDCSTRRLSTDTDSNRHVSPRRSNCSRRRSGPVRSSRPRCGTRLPRGSGIIPFAQPLGFILSQDSPCTALDIWHRSVFSCCPARLVWLSDAECVSVGLPPSVAACSCADRGALCAVVLTSLCFRAVHPTIGAGDLGIQTPPAPAPRGILSRRVA
jgi:hypothetical protein